MIKYGFKFSKIFPTNVPDSVEHGKLLVENISDGNLSSAIMLIRAGADVTVTDASRHTPLVIAASFGCKCNPIIYALVQYAREQITKEDMDNALQAARENNKLEIVEFLQKNLQ